MELRNYQVLCNYGGLLSSMATTFDEKSTEYKVLACPIKLKSSKK